MTDRDRFLGVPVAPLVFGYAGVIPFVAGALAMALGSDSVELTAYFYLMSYASLILAFLGAVHWGLALAADRVAWGWYGVSVVPALLGWVAYGLIDPVHRIALLALGYVGVFLVDIQAVRAGLAPAWYPKLRKPLTVIVLIALGVVGFVAGNAGGAAQ